VLGGPSSDTTDMGISDSTTVAIGKGEMLDLSLVPIDDLLAEVSNRSECYIAAYKLKVDGGSKKETIYTHWQENCWFKNLALCAALNKDLMDCCIDRKDREC
jgi:hypothetical protein